MPKPIDTEYLELLRRIDELFTAHPVYGNRRLRAMLARVGIDVGRDRMRTCMQTLGLVAIRPKRNTSKANHQHKIYPYLLRGLKINRVNQVWSTDITYIPMAKGQNPWRARMRNPLAINKERPARACPQDPQHDDDGAEAREGLKNRGLWTAEIGGLMPSGANQGGGRINAERCELPPAHNPMLAVEFGEI